jgi:hypothetical protein
VRMRRRRRLAGGRSSSKSSFLRASVAGMPFGRTAGTGTGATGRGHHRRPGQRLQMTADAPENGLWIKAQQIAVAPHNALGFLPMRQGGDGAGLEIVDGRTTGGEATCNRVARDVHRAAHVHKNQAELLVAARQRLADRADTHARIDGSAPMGVGPSRTLPHTCNQRRCNPVTFRYSSANSGYCQSAFAV